MKLLIDINELGNYKSRDEIPLSCTNCNKNYTLPKNRVLVGLKRDANNYCSSKCSYFCKKIDDVELVCKCCNKSFFKSKTYLRKLFKKSKSKEIFCSKTCSAKNKKISIKQKIKVSNTLKQNYIKKYKKLGYVDDDFVIYKGKLKCKLQKCICTVCNKEFNWVIFKKTCSADCLSVLNKKSSVLAGRSSSSKPYHVRSRSQNERLMYQKIKETFPDALNNKRMFGEWDADIIIPSLKITIHWNGIWHYRNIFRNEYGQQLLESVKSKDLLKYKAIEEHGYKNYVIEDLGSFNVDKVNFEFNSFIKTINPNCISTVGI